MLARLLVILLLGAAVSSSLHAADCGDDLSKWSPKELVIFLRTKAHSADPHCVAEAIRWLGESRSATKPAIEVLISLLDFKRPETEAEKMHVSSNRDWFPAVPALFGMGKDAVEPLIAHLKSNEMTETARHNGIRAILTIYREDQPEAVAALIKAAKNATSQVEAVALETCAADAAKQCAKSVRSRCEAVLSQR